MKIIKLLDYLADNCPYIFCKQNQIGSCLVDDEDFLADRMDEAVDNKDYLNNISFDCNYFEAEEGCCEECGRELTKTINIYEAWGRPVEEEYWECPYCD